MGTIGLRQHVAAFKSGAKAPQSKSESQAILVPKQELMNQNTTTYSLFTIHLNAALKRNSVSMYQINKLLFTLFDYNPPFSKGDYRGIY